MERRVTSHTEEEEMNQRRHLLALARKGDQKAVSQLMELYQVRVFSGDSLKSSKIRKSLPVLNPPKPKETIAPSKQKPVKKHKVAAKKPKATLKATRPAASKAKSASPKPIRSKTKVSPKIQSKSPKPVSKSKPSRKIQSAPGKISRTVSTKSVAKKRGTGKPTSKPRVQPRNQTKAQVKKVQTKVRPKAKAKTQATRKTKSTPASKAKRSR